MPDIRNCRRCGKIFNYIGGAPLCPVCREKDEDDFRRIKDYLYKNPGTALSEVSTVLDIGVEKIRRYLKEGRLEIVNESGNFILECEGCGKSIKTGRFCEICEKELSREFKSTSAMMGEEISQSQARKSLGMRYLNKEVK